MFNRHVLFIVVFSLAAAFELHQVQRCGTQGLSASFRSQLEQLRATGKAAEDVITIPTWFHVVSLPGSSYSVAQSELSTVLARQVDVLNQAYAPGGFAFDLVSATYTEHETWSRTQTTRAEMGASLRQGGYDTLNLYFLSEMIEPYNALGIATAPRPADELTAYVFWSDSALVWQNCMPGGAFESCDIGYTAVHEVGHWLGLEHVFDILPYGDGPPPISTLCTYDDGVADTALQYSATEMTSKSDGCNVNKDTCPGDPGLDNVSNFMDYSSDFCMQGFTPGQFALMRDVYQAFRAGT